MVKNSVSFLKEHEALQKLENAVFLQTAVSVWNREKTQKNVTSWLQKQTSKSQVSHKIMLNQFF